MTNAPPTGMLVLDWPDSATSHKFVKSAAPPEENYAVNGNKIWYRCKLCGGHKLVKTNSPEERIIWKTVPLDMTGTCPSQS